MPALMFCVSFKFCVSASVKRYLDVLVIISNKEIESQAKVHMIIGQI